MFGFGYDDTKVWQAIAELRERLDALEARHTALVKAIDGTFGRADEIIKILAGHMHEHCQQLAELRQQVSELKQAEEVCEVCHEEPAGD